MWVGRSPLLVGLVLVSLILGLANPALAYRRRRGRGSQAAAQMKKQLTAAALAQVAAGQQLLAAAQMKGSSAQSNYQAAISKVEQAVSQYAAAQNTVRDLAKQLLEIEHEILAEQSADSPYGLAQLAFERAKRELQQVEAKLLAPTEVQAKLSGAEGFALTTLKKDVLELYPEYHLAKAQVDLTAKEVERIRRELYREDQDWKDAAEALTEARHEQADTEQGTHNVSRLTPLKEFKNAQQAAAAAQMMIAQGQSTLKSLNYKAPTSSSSKTK